MKYAYVANQQISNGEGSTWRAAHFNELAFWSEVEWADRNYRGPQLNFQQLTISLRTDGFFV